IVWLLYHISFPMLLNLAILLWVAMPAIVIIVAITAAIALGNAEQSSFVLVLVLPLLIPLLILGVTGSSSDSSILPQFNLLLLLAASIFMLSVAPFILKYVLKVNCGS